MDAYFVLADTAARSAAHGDIAFSALPHAPVRPVVERRHRTRTLVTALRHASGLVTVRRSPRVADCVTG